MEALAQLANTNPGNPAGEAEINNSLNKQIWDYVSSVQEAAKGADEGLGGYPSTVGNFIDKVAATPGVGVMIPGVSSDRLSALMESPLYFSMTPAQRLQLLKGEGVERSPEVQALVKDMVKGNALDMRLADILGKKPGSFNLPKGGR